MTSPPRDARVHLPTLIAISALAVVTATAVHEHLGHATACVALGSRPLELGAYYVVCDDARLSELGVRLVALAGTVASLLLGLLAFVMLRRKPGARPELWFFTWLLGALGLMEAAGYPLFSGVGGIGDLGVGRDGLLAGATHAGAWRIAFALGGAALYYAAVRFAVRRIDPVLPGTGRDKVRFGGRMALTCYLTGAAVSIAIGALNPRGLVIVVISSAAATLGGTSGLLWMMQLLDRRAPEADAPLSLRPRWGWIAASIAGCALYAVVFGPTLRP